MVPAPTRSTVVDQVVEAIVERVRLGRYVPGQRLIEADLTADLGVSRGPLREALSRLASQGLLDISPHRGAVVRRLTRTDVTELFAMRELLEGEAARLAARNVNVDDARSTFRLLARSMRSYRTAKDWKSYVDTNTALHDAIVAASGNSLLQQMVEQLSTQAFRVQFRSSRPSWRAMKTRPGNECRSTFDAAAKRLWPSPTPCSADSPTGRFLLIMI
jgi:DNA-binding GntR family transcriptional regulator